MTTLSHHALRVVALLCAIAASFFAHALDIDRTFGVHGYVPISAPEAQVDTAAAIVRQPDDRMVVLGTRRIGSHGVLLLQRYANDGTPDAFFGQLGTTTIDIAGVSLSAHQLFLKSDGNLLAVADDGAGVRVYQILANGQLDTTYAIGGELQIPVAAGAAPGTSSAYLYEDGNLLVISQGAPGPNSSLIVSRYQPTGVIDDNFGLHGREVITGIGSGLAYTGLATVLADGAIIVALAANDATRALLVLDRFGRVDSGVNSGQPVMPAPLQGRTITKLAALASGNFIAAAVGGTGGAQTTTLTRFDSTAHVDTTFGTGGTITVSASDSGGSIAITDLYETPDNTLVLTGSTNNGVIVARYLARGVADTSFNQGRGAVVFAEPGSRATVGITSIQYPRGHIVTLGHGVLFGTTATGASPSRAFLVSTIDGQTELGFTAKGITNLFGAAPPNSEFAQHVVPLADGKVLVLSATVTGSPTLTGTLSRYLPNGALDPAYGTNGRSTFTVNGRCEWPLSLAVQPDGSALVLGTSFNMLDCNTSVMYAKKFTPAGAEQNFPLVYSGLTQRARSGAIAVQSDGRIVVTGSDDKSLVVARYLADGTVDASFGSGGRALLQPAAIDELRGGAISIRADQKIVVAGAMNGTHLVLLQLNANGTTDAAFGTNGITQVAIPGVFLEVHAMTGTPAGKLLVLAQSGQRALLVQFTTSGALDTGFGNGGQLLLPIFIGGPQYAHFGMTLQADGGIVVSGQSAVDVTSEVQLVRVTGTGQLDASFGPGGVWKWKPSVFYPSGASGIAAAGGGRLYLAGYGIPGAFLARLGAAVVTVRVVEFYNTTLDHYFITANAAEADAIDHGSAGPGWMRTGLGFDAFPAGTGGPAGAVPVCRFYGSTAINPATGQRRGPNSHFYTADAAECAEVQRDPGWTLEGIAFHIHVPVGGACAAGTAPVYRNFNRRAAQNDSNHRYTTSLGVYQLMQSQNWAGEGIVFFAP